MLLEKKDSLFYYRFESLDDDVLLHAVFTRLGGVSSAPYDSLNIGSTVGDDPLCVSKNVNLIFTSLGIAANQVVSPHQVHGCSTARVGRAQGGTIIPDCDALVTNEPGAFLLMRFADCVPVMLYDPRHAAVGLVHAGWQGTIKRVTVAAVERMQAEFATHPQDICAGIGPSIGPCCLEVGPEVAEQVRCNLNAEGLLSGLKPDGHVQLDIWQANYDQLVCCGVNRIEVARVCTCCHQSEFYSHRGSQGKTGRFGAIIGLR